MFFLLNKGESQGLVVLPKADQRRTEFRSLGNWSCTGLESLQHKREVIPLASLCPETSVFLLERSSLPRLFSQRGRGGEEPAANEHKIEAGNAETKKRC